MTAEPVNREALARELKAVRDRFTMAQPDKPDTPWAVMTRAIEALSRPDAERAEVSEPPIAQKDGPMVPGFYWVRTSYVDDGNWTVSKFDGEKWAFVDALFSFSTEDMVADGEVGAFIAAAPPPPIPSSTGGERTDALVSARSQAENAVFNLRQPGTWTTEDAARAFDNIAETISAALSRPQPVAETVEAVITDEMVERAAMAMARALGGTSSEVISPSRFERHAARAALVAALRPSAHGEAG